MRYLPKTNGRVQNLLDFTEDDVKGGSLNVVHSCSDEEGELMYQVRKKYQTELANRLMVSKQSSLEKPRFRFCFL